MSKFLPLFTLLAACGTGLMAGLFFAFSALVVQALSMLPPEQGLAAMQSINAEATTALFGLAFFGTAFLCAVLVIAALGRASTSRSAALLLAGSLLYLVGVVGVTVAFNVPLNKTLASTAPAQAAEYLPRYLAAWAGWNHARTAIASAALICFVWSAYTLGAPPAPLKLSERSSA